MTDTIPSTKPPAAAIHALTIERFRGITYRLAVQCGSPSESTIFGNSSETVARAVQLKSRDVLRVSFEIGRSTNPILNVQNLRVHLIKSEGVHVQFSCHDGRARRLTISMTAAA